MSVKKVKGGYVVTHCHGSDRGKRVTKKPVSKSKAHSIHGAIQAGKKR